jgi:elongation factor G
VATSPAAAGAGDLAGHLRVQGLAPLAELSNYQTRLNAMTSGQGRYTIELSHYDAVPPNVQAQLVAGYRVQEEE